MSISRGELTRAALMDSAEELFALHGIDAASDRGIAEHAGAANHSAVRYHFGGREGLIQALIARGQDHMNRRAEELISSLGSAPALREVMMARMLPYTEYLAELPVPSWHARFMFQLSSIPSGREAMHAVTTAPGNITELLEQGAPELAAVTPGTLRSRARMVEGMVLGVCSTFESQLARGDARGSWPQVAYFVIDAAYGLLTAPVTHPADFVLSDQTL